MLKFDKKKKQTRRLRMFVLFLPIFFLQAHRCYSISRNAILSGEAAAADNNER